MILPGFPRMLTMGGPSVPKFVGATEVRAASAAVSVSVPAGTANSDLMVAIVHSSPNSGTFTPPTGWTQILFDANGGPQIAVCYRVASSEPASYSFNGGGTAIRGAILTYRGATTVAVGSVQRAVATTVVAPSMTSVGGGVLIAVFASNSGGNTPATPPTGMTERVNPNSSSSAPRVYIYDEVPTSAGATGTRTMVWTTGFGPGFLLEVIP